jgi:hypothetical protein
MAPLPALQTCIIFLNNFVDGLRRKVPVGKKRHLPVAVQIFDNNLLWERLAGLRPVSLAIQPIHHSIFSSKDEPERGQ